jgi:hypothetical protein
MDMLEGDVELTEFEAIDVQSIKGVKQGANGFPILMMKGLAAPVAKGKRDCPKCEKTYDADHKGDKCENCGATLPDADTAKAADGKVDCPTCKGDGKIMDDKRDCPDCDAKGKVTPAKAKTLTAKALVKAIVGRKVDEAPDIAGGTAVLAQIADLIIGEAQELKAGQAGEIDDIFQLARAAEMIWCWRTGEEAVGSGSVMPATALMQSAAKEAGLTGDQWAAWAYLVKSRDYSAAERKEMADDGRALPDGSYPIADEHDLNSAAILARSGHGDVTAAKKHIGKRAKELGVKNPLDDKADDTSKSRIAEEGPDVDTMTQGTGSLTKAVEDAVTKAVAPLQERIKTLSDDLAKVKATPVPGGPMMSVARPAQAATDDHAAKAAYFDRMAETVAKPEDADSYRQLAAQERAKTTASS